MRIATIILVLLIATSSFFGNGCHGEMMKFIAGSMKTVLFTLETCLRPIPNAEQITIQRKQTKQSAIFFSCRAGQTRMLPPSHSHPLPSNYVKSVLRNAQKLEENRQDNRRGV